jgi:hypothetical protein
VQERGLKTVYTPTSSRTRRAVRARFVPADNVCTVCICDATTAEREQGTSRPPSFRGPALATTAPINNCSWDIFPLCLRLRYAFDCALIVFLHLSSHRLYSDAIGCTQDFFSGCKASIHSEITEVQLPFCASSIVELLLESISLLEITSSLVKSMDCIPATCSLCF